MRSRSLTANNVTPIRKRHVILSGTFPFYELKAVKFISDGPLENEVAEHRYSVGERKGKD